MSNAPEQPLDFVAIVLGVVDVTQLKFDLDSFHWFGLVHSNE